MLTEYVSGILYLFGGVVFLPGMFPSWGQVISTTLPITYFLKSIRFSILHQASFNPQIDLLYLALTTIATMFMGAAVFRVVEYKARRDGLIDKKEEY